MGIAEFLTSVIEVFGQEMTKCCCDRIHLMQPWFLALCFLAESVDIGSERKYWTPCGISNAFAKDSCSNNTKQCLTRIDLLDGFEFAAGNERKKHTPKKADPNAARLMICWQELAELPEEQKKTAATKAVGSPSFTVLFTYLYLHIFSCVSIIGFFAMASIWGRCCTSSGAAWRAAAAEAPADVSHGGSGPGLPTATEMGIKNVYPLVN